MEGSGVGFSFGRCDGEALGVIVGLSAPGDTEGFTDGSVGETEGRGSTPVGEASGVGDAESVGEIDGEGETEGEGIADGDTRGATAGGSAPPPPPKKPPPPPAPPPPAGTDSVADGVGEGVGVGVGDGVGVGVALVEAVGVGDATAPISTSFDNAESAESPTAFVAVTFAVYLPARSAVKV